jgi:hypothetical protein
MYLKSITAIALFAATMIHMGYLLAAGPHEGVTALSRKVDAIGMRWTRAAVINTLGAPSSVITPGKLKANDIDRGPEIEYVLAWDNPGCSRIEVFFNARNQVTGTDAGRMCAYPMKPLAADYSCSKSSNGKYCR